MKRYHAGTSLIEVMVTMGVGSTILMIAIGWIHQSMTLSSAVRQRHAQHQRLLVWTRQFRDDVRMSRSVQQPTQDELVIIADERRTIRYSIDPEGLRRELKRTNGPSTSELLPLNEKSLITLRLNQEQPQQVEWLIGRSLPTDGLQSSPSSSRVDLAITATVAAGLPPGVTLSVDAAEVSR